MGNTVNVELTHPTVETSSTGWTYLRKDELGCWPGRAENCQKPREWAVFHNEEEAALPFDYLASVYIGTCSEHLPLALRRDPTAINYVRPY